SDLRVVDLLEKGRDRVAPCGEFFPVLPERGRQPACFAKPPALGQKPDEAQRIPARLAMPGCVEGKGRREASAARSGRQTRLLSVSPGAPGQVALDRLLRNPSEVKRAAARLDRGKEGVGTGRDQA